MSRSFCYQCQRVQEACLCDQISQLDNPVSVYVLQHPDESRINKGSAIIAKLALKNYHCWQGEDFSSHEALNQLIEKQADHLAVVYPAENAITVNASIMHKTSGERALKNNIKHLVFIDATWRKAKKIWMLSTNLHDLPALKLDADHPSNYRIRKVPADGYLSTVEAIAECLSVLENDAEKYHPMLDLFDSMINFQIEKMGHTTYERNYKK